MKRSDLTEFEFEEEGFKIKIKRGSEGQPLVTSSPLSSALQQTAGPVSMISTTKDPASATALTIDDTGFTFVKSPMVGTFYRSPSPTSQR